VTAPSTQLLEEVEQLRALGVTVVVLAPTEGAPGQDCAGALRRPIGHAVGRAGCVLILNEQLLTLELLEAAWSVLLGTWPAATWVLSDCGDFEDIFFYAAPAPTTRRGRFASHGR
jgi:hypothetical protein